MSNVNTKKVVYKQGRPGKPKDRLKALRREGISGITHSSTRIMGHLSVSSGITDDSVANNFIEYETDMYIASEFAVLTSSDLPGVDLASRQLNINTQLLPGVSRNEDDSENKRPVLVEGKLYARPLFRVSAPGSASPWDANPNVFNGRLVTPLGTDLGGLGASDETSLYDNSVFNLEPNVNQDYVHVNTYKYMQAMPGLAPASRVVGGEEYTNLFCIGLQNPDGTVWAGGAVALRFILRYRVPVVLKSALDFQVSTDDGAPSGGVLDGILCPARNIKDTILPNLNGGVTGTTAAVEQPIFPDARRIIKQ
jgi:hypothetical protein